jgi:hypothetical protein
MASLTDVATGDMWSERLDDAIGAAGEADKLVLVAFESPT